MLSYLCHADFWRQRGEKDILLDNRLGLHHAPLISFSLVSNMLYHGCVILYFDCNCIPPLFVLKRMKPLSHQLCGYCLFLFFMIVCGDLILYSLHIDKSSTESHLIPSWKPEGYTVNIICNFGWYHFYFALVAVKFQKIKHYSWYSCIYLSTRVQ